MDRGVHILRHAPATRRPEAYVLCRLGSSLVQAMSETVNDAHKAHAAARQEHNVEQDFTL
jgi:hypothetical protein